MQPFAFVSPASRGIGLQLAKQLLRNTNVPVVATARTDLDQFREHVLDDLPDVREDRLHVVKVDVLGTYASTQARKRRDSQLRLI
jgi:NAD(P)-dependent dehydrogenase (short-subunit alcohol dehydrogenase family)